MAKTRIVEITMLRTGNEWSSATSDFPRISNAARRESRQLRVVENNAPDGLVADSLPMPPKM